MGTSSQKNSPEKDAPTWSMSLLATLLTSINPFFEKILKNPKSELEILPTDLGVTIGRSYWMLRHMRDNLPPFDKPKMLDEKSEEILKETIEKQICECEKMILKVLHEPFCETKKFFEGFSKGISQDVFTENGYNLPHPYHRELYWLLVNHKERVEAFASVTDLHKWCHEKLGVNQVPDLDSFRKLCQRIGLVLGKRGRPSKK